MARIVGGSMLGELSGKLGGNVFARNKAGAYIRQYVVPVNPNTQAQAYARAAFGTSSASYHSLDSVQKNKWTNFAQNLYLPKHGTNEGQYSGFNAYVALRNVVQNANRLLINNPTVQVNNVANTITDVTAYSNSSIPPTHSIQGNILLQSTSGATTPYITECTLSNNGSFSFKLSFGSSTSPVATDINEQLQDGSQNPIGFAVYISNPIQQSSMFITNPEIITIGYIPNFTLQAGTGTGVETIKIAGATVDLETYQSWVVAGNYIRMTVYQTTMQGQIIKLGSETIQVST